MLPKKKRESEYMTHKCHVPCFESSLTLNREVRIYSQNLSRSCLCFPGSLKIARQQNNTVQKLGGQIFTRSEFLYHVVRTVHTFSRLVECLYG